MTAEHHGDERCYLRCERGDTLGILDMSLRGNRGHLVDGRFMIADINVAEVFR